MISIAPEDFFFGNGQFNWIVNDTKMMFEVLFTEFPSSLRWIPLINASSPLTFKYAINTHPDLGMPTTIENYALLNSKPRKSATIVDKVRKCGHASTILAVQNVQFIEHELIILGKTNINVGLQSWNSTLSSLKVFVLIHLRSSATGSM